MEEAGQRAARLTRQLLAFGRRQILHVEIIELNAEIEALTKMIERLIGEDVSLTLRLGEQPLRIKADAGQLEQVLLNLAINARDAMPRGGHLVIETERIELSEGHAARREVAAGPYALIAVSDTGVGMSRDTLDRIFEPFYTTKEPGRGTGLGLSTVYGVVKQHGGHVSVYSEVGHGSVFRIYLPLTEEPAAPPKPAADIRLPSGDETILVVEDDQAIRQLVCAALRRHGYRVVEATSPREAVSLAEAPGGIDLLLTDVVMPDLSGPELADRVRELLPDTRVLFMTGYAEEILAHHGVDYGEFLLRKPFTARALALRVREVLDR
ncbi:MAG: response regulator [Armatimonadetes bacterium]|nr:response regulator [Armatimonadota bacterium]